MRKKILKNENGQTAVEYILMLVVAAALTTSFLNYIKTRYLGDGTKCNGVNKNTLFCQIFRGINPNAGEEGRNQFRYYRLKR